MGQIEATIPDPIEDVLVTKARVEDKSLSRVVSDELEEQLDRDGMLDHLDEQVREELREQDEIEASAE